MYSTDFEPEKRQCARGVVDKYVAIWQPIAKRPPDGIKFSSINLDSLKNGIRASFKRLNETVHLSLPLSGNQRSNKPFVWKNLKENLKEISVSRGFFQASQ